MRNKTRKHIWPGVLVMSIAMVGLLAALVVLVNNPGGAAAHDAADHAADCEKMSDRERATHNQLYPDAPCEEGPVPGGNGDDGNGNGNGTVSPSQANGFVATAAAGRTVELEWRPIAGATGYEIRYRNLDMTGRRGPRQSRCPLTR